MSVEIKKLKKQMLYDFLLKRLKPDTNLVSFTLRELAEEEELVYWYIEQRFLNRKTDQIFDLMICKIDPIVHVVDGIEIECDHRVYAVIRQSALHDLLRLKYGDDEKIKFEEMSKSDYYYMTGEILQLVDDPILAKIGWEKYVHERNMEVS